MFGVNMERKISLRISDEDLEVIDSFINRNDFSNRSVFIREAALDYIHRHSITKDEHEIPARISLHKDTKNSILYWIAIGHYRNWENALQDLVERGMLTKDIGKIESHHEALGSISKKVEALRSIEKDSSKYMTK